MKCSSNEKGFTLVELMVVVAIIGILSAIAIPNFKKYQAKSKTSEAKLQLSSVYSAETAIQTDYDSFATCLADAGYVSPNNAWDVATDAQLSQGSNYYSVGFAGGNSKSNQNVIDNGGVCDLTNFYGIPAYKKVGGLRTNVGHLDFAITKSMGGTAAEAAEEAVTFMSIMFSPLYAAGSEGQSTPGVDDAGGYFIAGAVAYLDTAKATPELADKWAIDQDKQLYQIKIGY